MSDASRFFAITDFVEYEAMRVRLDVSRQMPRGETTYAPLNEAPQATNNSVLLAIRASHCLIPDIANALVEMASNGWGAEITETDYWSWQPEQKAVGA
jgi:hypothetical protein